MPALRILVLSEDGSPRAHEVVVALAKTMLKIVDAGVQTQREKLQFDDGARVMLTGSKWYSNDEEHESALRGLLRAIVQQLLINDDDGHPSGFVFFHYDGDDIFANWETNTTHRKFAEFRLRIEEQIRARAQNDEEAVRRIMSRLVAIVPFYCIESWTYQHTDVAKKICARGCGKHRELFNDWALDRGKLDEIWKLWDREMLDCCLGKDNNVELTGPGYPAESVWDAEKSYYRAVDQMAECSDLVEALARTYALPTPQQER